MFPQLTAMVFTVKGMLLCLGGVLWMCSVSVVHFTYVIAKGTITVPLVLPDIISAIYHPEWYDHTSHTLSAPDDLLFLYRWRKGENSSREQLSRTLECCIASMIWIVRYSLPFPSFPHTMKLIMSCCTTSCMDCTQISSTILWQWISKVKKRVLINCYRGDCTGHD